MEMKEGSFVPPEYLVKLYSYYALQSPWAQDAKARYDALSPWQKRKLRIRSRINKMREHLARPAQHVANKIRGYDYGDYDQYDY